MSVTAVQPWHEPLGERELQILSLISEGYSNREIAQRLSLSLDTVKWYNKQLFSKLGVSSRTQAVAAARQYRLLDALEPAQADAEARPQHNLPYIPTSFIGRRKEIAEVKHLLQTSRLVVLTGAGGSGKTRMALQAAYELIGSYPDGIWLVELTPLSDPAQVPDAIAGVLRVIQSGNAPLVSSIQHFLQPKRLLLVLDNFEHLLDASPVVGELISAAPYITILITSRERLHVYGEQEYIVHPLDLPDPAGDIPLEQLLGIESVSLFVEHARAVKRDLVLQPEDSAVVARMCVRLDGLPLALELAASRVKIFPLAVLAERLEDRLSLLSDGPRDLPARQRTLRDTIDWSYNLLDEAERMLFSRLAVFRGGGTLGAVESICVDGLPGDTIAVLSSLVDKSLVRPREGLDGELRFEMLETIREYAQERVSASGYLETLNRRFAEYHAELAELAARELRYARQRYWFARLRADYDNLRTALAWSLNGEEIAPGLRITAALRDYWYYTGHNVEYKLWTDIALERMPGAPEALRAGVMKSASQRYFGKSDSYFGKDLMAQAINLYETLGDVSNAAWSRLFLSALYIGELEVHQEGISIAIRSLEEFRRLDDLAGQAQALNILGEFTRMDGELDLSKAYYEECLEIVAQTGERLREGMLWENLGFIAFRQSHYREALQLMREDLKIMDEYQNDYGLMTAIASMSGPLTELGHMERAVHILSGTDAQLRIIGAEHQPADLPEIEEYRRLVYDRLGSEAYQAAWEVGSRLTIRELVELALEDVPED